MCLFMRLPNMSPRLLSRIERSVNQNVLQGVLNSFIWPAWVERARSFRSKGVECQSYSLSSEMPAPLNHKALLFILSFLAFANQVNNVLLKKCVWGGNEASQRWQTQKQGERQESSPRHLGLQCNVEEKEKLKVKQGPHCWAACITLYW